MSDAITITKLVKIFGRTRALDGLDLIVATGEVHGFLGPNGAGKSTTLRILLGLLRSNGGSVQLLGGDPRRDVNLWPNLSGGEVIDLLGRLRGGLDETRRADLIDRFELDPTKKGRTYSKGNRQKVALIAALATDVELLLLDEPTSGLDPLMESVFRDCILAERERGRTVLLSSHILSEVEQLCDRVSIIRAGRTVDSGTLSDLRHFTRTTIDAELSSPAHGFEGLPGIHNLTITGDGPVRVHCDIDPTALDEALRRLSGAGVLSLTSRPPTLEELFLRHYRTDSTDETKPILAGAG
jgi:ABC-2 type transport system ATP-binding protein